MPLDRKQIPNKLKKNDLVGIWSSGTTRYSKLVNQCNEHTGNHFTRVWLSLFKMLLTTSWSN